MKKWTKLSMLVVALGGFSVIPAMAASVAYVNIPYLFQHHPLRAKLINDINTVLQPKISNLKTQQTTVNADIKTLTKGIANKSLTKSEITTQENTITELKQAYAKNLEALQIEARQLQAAARARIMKSIDSAAESVATTDGYTYVISQQSVVYAPSSANITTQVLTQIKSQYPAVSPSTSGSSYSSSTAGSNNYSGNSSSNS